MFFLSLKSHRHWLMPAAVILALTGVFVARTASARLVMNTIDATGTVAEKGRHLTLGGPIQVDAGERTELRVVVTQRSTGAVAEGVAFIIGTGELEHWDVGVACQTRETFEPGPATAVAFARTTVNGAATDAHQWLVNITLVSE